MQLWHGGINWTNHIECKGKKATYKTFEERTVVLNDKDYLTQE